MRTVGADGAPTPVDLSLREDASSGFAPLAPIVALEVGDRAHEGITLDDIDVAVTPVGVDDARRHRAPGQGVLPGDRAGHRPRRHAAARGRGPRRAAALARQPGALPLARRAARTARACSSSAPTPGAEIIAADGAKLAHITAPVAWDADDQSRSRPRSPSRATSSSSTSRTAGRRPLPDHARPDDPRGRRPLVLELVRAVDLTGWKWTDPNSRFTYFYGARLPRQRPVHVQPRHAAVHRRRLRQLVLQRARHVADRPRRVQLRQARAADHRLVARAVQRRPHPTRASGATPTTATRRARGASRPTAGGACGASPFSTYGALNYNTKTHIDLEGTPGNAAIFGTSVYYTGNHADFTNFLGGATIWIEDDGRARRVTEDNGLSDGSWTSFRAFQARAHGHRARACARSCWTRRPTRAGAAPTRYDAGCTGDRALALPAVRASCTRTPSGCRRASRRSATPPPTWSATSPRARGCCGSTAAAPAIVPPAASARR